MNAKLAIHLILMLCLTILFVDSTKLGSCPQLTGESFGICVELCQTDENCNGNLKCVSSSSFLNLNYI
jgi:hypothetical protein